LDIQGEGVEIAATKSGTVAAVLKGGKWNLWCNSNADCSRKGGIWRGNHVLVNHPDGSQSLYFHMQPDSIPPNVFPGQPVSQGQTLGKMGYTGYTCKDIPRCTIPDPHVHFQVNKGGATISTPFEDCFYWFNPCQDGIPVAFQYYTSINTHPGGVFNQAALIYHSPVGGVLSLDKAERGSPIITRAGFGGELQRWLWVDGRLIGTNNWCLEAVPLNDLYTYGSPLKVWDCTGRFNQNWELTNFNQIRLKHTNLCVSGGLRLDTTPELRECAKSPEQVWIPGPSNSAGKFFEPGTGTPGLV
jgi:Peptidase family M23/Ricin-type beta-trefoil lectin domain